MKTMRNFEVISDMEIVHIHVSLIV